jgi:hypothetical protein
MKKEKSFFKWVLLNAYYYVFLLVSTVSLTIMTMNLISESFFGIIGAVLFQVLLFQAIFLLILFLIYKYAIRTKEHSKKRIKGLNNAITAITILIFLSFLIFLKAYDLLAIPFNIVFAIFWIWMIIDVIRIRFKNKNERILWILVVILASIFGAILYYFVVKRLNK